MAAVLVDLVAGVAFWLGSLVVPLAVEMTGYKVAVAVAGLAAVSAVVAMELVTCPDVIVLDEPTSGHDAAAAAYEAAMEVGAEVVLGNRAVNLTTLARTWAALSTWERLRFMWQLLYTGINLPTGDNLKSQVEELKDSDALTQAFLDLAAEFPSLLRPLIHERDEFMVAQLRRMGSMPRVGRVVAVVGAGHCRGIQDKWEADIPLEEITRLPPKEDWERTRKLVLCSTGLSVMTNYVQHSIQLPPFL